MSFDPEWAGAADFARLYRELGLQVVPSVLPQRGKQWKRPAVPWRPLENELCADELFEEWFGPGGAFANHDNVGLICGRCSGGAFIIDLDLYKNPQAQAWWDEMLSLRTGAGDLETPCQRTGGGGLQLLFRAPKGWTPPTFKTAGGVDVRGQGGFAVLAPSRHESGRRYEWLPGQAPWDLDVAEAPRWLCEQIDALAASERQNPQAPGPSQKTSSPGAAYNALGLQIDGREETATRIVWARVVDLYREAPILPHPDTLERHLEECFQLYERKCKSRLYEPGTPNAVLLEREGRGISMMRAKWQAALSQWSGKVREHASVPSPRERREEAPQKAAGAQEKAQGSDEWDAPPSPPAPAVFDLDAYFPIDGASIPTRSWIVPGLLMRSHLSVLVAPPGSGKSLFSVQMAIAAAVGIEWGGWRVREPQKVLLVNAEDDADEMRRRLYAAAEEMGVAQSDLAGRIFGARNPDNVVIAQSDAKTKVVHRTQLFDAMTSTIVENGIGVAVVDPFAETFVGDENSNSEVKWAAIAWREMARLTDCALMLVHHTRKYAGQMAGDPDASRGGGALIGTARIVSTMFTMSDEDAAALGVEAEERFRYVRFDDAKSNLTKISGRARWFEKVSVTLPNGSGEEPADEIGVLRPWTPPGAFDGVSSTQVNQILDRIRDGAPDATGAPSGEFYVMSDRSPRYVGQVAEIVLGVPRQQAKRVIETWRQTGLISEIAYDDVAKKRVVKRVVVNEAMRPGRVS